MRKKSIYISVFFFILSLSVDLYSKIDHIRFGSRNDPLNGLTISWRGNYTHSCIKWGYTTEFEQGKVKVEGRNEFGDENFFMYDFSFPPVQPNSDIYYALQELTGDYDAVEYTGEWGEVRTFRTSTAIDASQFSFIAGGDSRGGPGDYNMQSWEKIADILGASRSDFYIFVGDLSLVGGNRMLWDTWYRSGKKFLSSKLIYHCAGNHERYGDPELVNFRNQFVLPENGDFSETYYSFEFGNGVFLVLNTEFNKNTAKGRASHQKQNQWLRLQLKKYRGSKRKNYKEWVIVVFHKPFFTIDKHMGEMTGGDRENDYDNDYTTVWWKELFDRYGVDVILNGHTHLYMRAVPIRLRKTGIIFDQKGLPSEPSKKIEYGNKKRQGRLQIVTGGYGVDLKKEKDLYFKDQWFVDNYKLAYHYCQFYINGKTLRMEVKSLPDGKVIDQVTIAH